MNKPAQIFIAYSRADEALLTHFRKHLSALERNGQARIWYDGQIEAGAVWERETTTALHNADMVLLMISASFLASDQSYEGEMKTALQLHETGKTRVVPVILKNCLWEDSPFAHLQVLPASKKALADDSEVTLDDRFAEVVRALAALIEQTDKSAAAPPFTQSTNGLYTDPRDQQTYPTLQIGGNIWLAKNLQFDPGEGVWPNNQDGKTDAQYGLLYTWETAQQACPPGWQLPDVNDWDNLINYFGENYMAFKHLRLGGSTGMDILPGGKYSTASHQIVLAGTDAFYWTGTPANFEQAYYYMFDKGMAAVRKIAVDKQTGASVRCVWKNK